MSVSKLLPAGGNNDFNVSITGTYTVVTFTKEYSAGAYTLTSSLSDTTYDIYVFNSDGSSAGYSKTPSLTATKGFSKMVVLGGAVGDLLSFVYKTTYTSADETAEVGAGPVVVSVSPTDAPNVDSSITVTGRNFASDVGISFTNTGYGPTAAKNIVRSSATSLIVTRPDTFPLATSAYTITASNPGVTNPTGTNSHILATSVTAGNAPVWSTAATLPTYTKNVAYSTTLVATDSSDTGSIISYSIVSGLPTGFTLASTSGVLAGTTTSSTVLTTVVRATDSGGNFVDRTFTIPNTAPTWVTSAGALTTATKDSAYSVTLSATDDSGSTPTFALVSGSLPTGLSLNSATGAITGTPTVGSNLTSSSFTISATDSNSASTNRAFTIYVLSDLAFQYTATGSFTPSSTITNATVVLVAGGGGGGFYSGANVGAGGGGAGGVISNTGLTLTSGTTYSFTIGGGQGSTPAGTSGEGYRGGSTTFTGLTTVTGGGGGGGQSTGGSGGSGGAGGSASGGAGTAGQGNNGGSSSDQDAGGGGGGKSAVGGTSSGTVYAMTGAGGAGATYGGIAVGGGGGGGHSNRSGATQALIASSQSAFGGGVSTLNGNGGNGTAGTGGGGGGSSSTAGGGTGGGGCVIIIYQG